MKIYLWQDDREWGPFTKEEIFLKLKTKEIALEAFARLETDTAWRTLNEVLAFSPLVSLRPKTPSPAQSLPSLFPKPYEGTAAHPSPKAASRKVAPAGRGGLGVFQGTMGFALLLGLGVLAFGWLSRPSVHPANQSADRSNWNAGERPDADTAPGMENDKAFPSTDNENAAGVSRSVPNAAPFADEFPSSVAAVGQNGGRGKQRFHPRLSRRHQALHRQFRAGFFRRRQPDRLCFSRISNRPSPSPQGRRAAAFAKIREQPARPHSRRSS